MAKSRKPSTEQKARKGIPVPKKGSKCVRMERSKDRFHKGSFRWTREQDKGKGEAFVLVGCPLGTRPTKGPRKGGHRLDDPMKTRWVPSAPKGYQCQFMDGSKAGLRAHLVVQPRQGGTCRTGYSRE